MSSFLDHFVAIDVEIASRSPTRVCAIGAARFEERRETGAFQSLVQVEGRVRFGGIHGLGRAELLRAPPWPTVWREVLHFIGDIRPLVAYPAAFDRGALLVMCAAHGLRPPPLPFLCAATLVERRLGRKLDLVTALDELGIAFPGRHHNALADARAAASIVVACTPDGPAASGEA